MSSSIIVIFDQQGSFPSPLKDRLVSNGFEVIERETGTEIFHFLAIERPQLAILSSKMPEMDGAQICKMTKDNLSLKHIPILILDSTLSPATQRTCIEAGCDGYYQRPFDVEAIMERLDILLPGARKTRSRSMTRLQLDFKTSQEITSLFAGDMEEGTLFLRIKNPFPVGTGLKLKLSVASKKLVEAYGEVIHTIQKSTNPKQPVGMVVKMLEMDEETRAFIQNLYRQRSLASNDNMEELTTSHIEDTLVAVITGKKSTEGTFLSKLKFNPATLTDLEREAFEARNLPQPEKEELHKKIRDGVSFTCRIAYHLKKYRQLEFLSDEIRTKFLALSRTNLELGNAALGKLTPLMDRAKQKGLTELLAQLHSTSANLSANLTELNGKVQNYKDSLRKRKTVSTKIPNELLHDKEIVRYLEGISELFDFSTDVTSRSYMESMKLDLDLSELAAWEVTSFMEINQPGKTINPEVANWLRAIVALRFAISAFNHQHGKEDWTIETIDRSVALLNMTLACQEKFQQAMTKFIADHDISKTTLEELSQSNKQILDEAMRLNELYNPYREEDEQEYGPLLTHCYASIKEIFKHRETAEASAIGGQKLKKKSKKKRQYGPQQEQLTGVRGWLARYKSLLSLFVMIVLLIVLINMYFSRDFYQAKAPGGRTFSSITKQDLKDMWPCYWGRILEGDLSAKVNNQWMKMTPKKQLKRAKRLIIIAYIKWPKIKRIRLFDNKNKVLAIVVNREIVFFKKPSEED